jgi:hypothetical protein
LAVIALKFLERACFQCSASLTLKCKALEKDLTNSVHHSSLGPLARSRSE